MTSACRLKTVYYIIVYIRKVESRVQIIDITSIIACFLVAGETCPHNYSSVKAVLLSPVYTAVILKWSTCHVTSCRVSLRECRTELWFGDRK
jgi:hypothetical protein